MGEDMPRAVWWENPAPHAGVGQNSPPPPPPGDSRSLVLALSGGENLS